MPHQPRPLPPSIGDRFELCEQAPSGLKYRTATRFHAAGEPAGSKTKQGHYMIPYDNRMWYAHRVVYFLRHGEDPGNALVLHTVRYDNRARLKLGDQKENRADTGGKRNGSPNGYRSKYMVGDRSLRNFCLENDIPYHVAWRLLNKNRA